MRMKIATWAAVMAALALDANATEYTLVENGKPNARIQSNPTPSAQEFKAVTELQNCIQKISGAKVNRNTAPGVIYRTFRGEDKNVVEIMPVTLENGCGILPEKAIRKLKETSSPDAFYILSENSPEYGKSIFIAGKTPEAVLYGTYAFIEDYLGVRFFHAGPEGEYCPREKSIRLKEIDDFRMPWAKTRKMSCWSGSVKPWEMKDVENWLTRRGYQWDINHNYSNLSRETLDHAACGNLKLMGGGHLTFKLAVPDSLFKTCPELFPLQNGNRVCKERSQRCLSNPEVKKKVVDYILRHIAYYDGSFCINFHDSTNGWCECEKCIQYGTGRDGKYSLSNVTHRFTVEVAEAVLKKNPKADLSFLVYSDYRNPPAIPLKFPSSLLCMYCPHQRCYVHPLDDRNSECNAKFLKQFLAWEKLCPRMGIFDYYAYSQSPYCPLEYTLAKDMKFYRDMKLDTWKDDCTNKALPIPASNWQFYYAASKLLWNADLDIDKLMDEAYTLYYGPAAVPMKKYHACRRQLWEAAPGHASYGGPKRYAYCLTVPGAEKRLTGYLDEAEKLAEKDPVVLKRIAADRGFLKEFWIAEAEKMKKSMNSSSLIPVAKRTGAVKIDGILEEDAWRSAPFVTPFKTLNDKTDPVEETRVKVLYDNDAWYIGIEAMTEHAWSKLVADVKTRDGEVWKDDCVEIFLVPPASEYYHWIVNSIGTIYDAQTRNTAFESKAEVKTRVLKDRYVVEMRIPVKPMGKDSLRDGDVWQLHFCRDCQNLQPPKTSETSTIDGIPPHEQTQFHRAPTGISVLFNPGFSKMQKVPENQKKAIFSDQFPDGWGASNAKLVTGPDHTNSIELKDVVYTYLHLPENGKPTKVSGEILVSGKGKMIVTLSGCIRKAGDKRGFGHEKKEQIAEFALTEKPAAHKLEFETEADSRYYIYFQVRGGSAVIRNISLARP